MSVVVPLLSRLIAWRTDHPGGNEPALAELLATGMRARGADPVRLRATQAVSRAKHGPS